MLSRCHATRTITLSHCSLSIIITNIPAGCSRPVTLAAKPGDAVRRGSSFVPRLIGRGCAAETCLITIRPLDLHQYPRPPWIHTCFRHLPALPFHHQPSIPSRHQTARSPHPQTCPSPPVLPCRTRLLEVIHMPLKHIIGPLQTIVSPRKKAVSSGARFRPRNFRTNFFRSLKILKCVRTRGVLL